MNFRILTKSTICSSVFNSNQYILHETNGNLLLDKLFVYWTENLRLVESSIDEQTQNHMFLEFPVSILTVIFQK